MDDIIRQGQLSFFKKGWCEINTELIGIDKSINNKILKINKMEYEINKKNLGVYSLPQATISKKRVFNEISNNQSIINFAELLTGRKLFISCIMQMLTIGKTNCLDWHRDTYSRGSKFIGPIPPVIKIMFYNQEVYLKDGPFQVISGSHKFDLNNKFIDKLLPIFKSQDIKTFTNNTNKFIIFNGSLLHRRFFSKENGKRSATIISLESPKSTKN